MAGFGHFPALLQSALIDAAWGVLSDQTRPDVGRLITGPYRSMNARASRDLGLTAIRSLKGRQDIRLDLITVRDRICRVEQADDRQDFSQGFGIEAKLS